MYTSLVLCCTSKTTFFDDVSVSTCRDSSDGHKYACSRQRKQHTIQLSLLARSNPLHHILLLSLTTITHSLHLLFRSLWFTTSPFEQPVRLPPFAPSPAVSCIDLKSSTLIDSRNQSRSRPNPHLRKSIEDDVCQRTPDCRGGFRLHQWTKRRSCF